MMTTSIRTSILALALAACGGKSAPATETTTTPTPTETAQETPPPEGMAFKDMDLDQRKYFMKHTVMPTMRTAFQAFDGAKFAEFDCTTCHGDGAADGSFEMPDAKLPVLPGTEEAFMVYAQDPEHQPWIKFMAEEVKPEMAKLLQMTEFDPQTNTGDFSCGNCHTFEGQK